jgi:hypothetical protein
VSWLRRFVVLDTAWLWRLACSYKGFDRRSVFRGNVYIIVMEVLAALMKRVPNGITGIPVVGGWFKIPSTALLHAFTEFAFGLSQRTQPSRDVL